MKKKEVVFVLADDWEGMYIDGELVAEGHSLEVDTVCIALDIESEERWADDEWLTARGRLPKELKDVKFGG